MQGTGKFIHMQMRLYRAMIKQLLQSAGCWFMGEVILVFKILPKSPEGFEKIKKQLENLNPQRIEEEPIAFGLKAIKLTVIVPDAEGEQDKIENKIRQIDGVGEVEVLRASRSL